ncbi:MAG TPA: SgcJ/EcaC family oxidoreductase [Blastocatellia bacterium]
MSSTETRTATAADENAIRELHRKMIEASNSGDWTVFADSFTDDADLLVWDGTHLKGRREITSLSHGIFGSGVKGALVEGEVKFIHFLSPELAVMHAIKSISVPRQKEAVPSRNSMEMIIVTKEGDEWRCRELLNARRLTYEWQLFWDDFTLLPPEGQRQVSDLVRFSKKAW